MDVYALDEDNRQKENGVASDSSLPEGGNSSSSTITDKTALPTAPPLIHVGRTSILPQQYLVPDKSQGKITLTVFSPELLSIGTISCKSLVVAVD